MLQTTLASQFNIVPMPTEGSRVVMPMLAPDVHPIAELLMLTPTEILNRYREMQYRDFMSVFDRLVADDRNILDELPRLRKALSSFPDNPLRGIVAPERMGALFADLHDHVMHHPVWLHPFFCRFFKGAMTRDQLLRFLQQYLNQVKNTRQCVALACGRFHSLAALPFGPLNETVSELTQIVLAGLLADEYGTEAHDHHECGGSDVDVRELLDKVTHIVLYRQLYEMLGVSFRDQDAPLLHGVADNVLTQRLLAGSDGFTELEALASVGLGMEWGVPAFFSLLLGGIVKFAIHEDIAWTPRHVEVLSAHVRQDINHAVSVMLATALFARDDSDIRSIKNATNMLMASRYGMMTDMYRHVFGGTCPSLHEIELDRRYKLADDRIVDALLEARGRVPRETVLDHDGYLASERTPFVLAE